MNTRELFLSSFEHLKLIFLWQEVVDEVFDVRIGFQDGVSEQQ